MGANCTCVSGKKQPSHRKSDFSLYPDDLHNYQPQKRLSLPKLKFDALLYNIVVINYPKSSVSLKFCIDGIVEVPLPKKSQPNNNNQIRWISKERFNFTVDEYELRMKFLKVFINDDDGKSKEVLKINLYKIATGPYHNDFNLLPNKPNVRLKFDFKVSQYVQIKVNCRETFAELNEKSYPGESFHFTVRVLKEQNEEPFESNPSYVYMNPYQKSQKQQQVSSQYDECPSPIKIRGRLPPKPTRAGCNFAWLAQKGEMPNFCISLKSDQIQKTILHLVIWRAEGEVDVDDIKQTTKKNEEDVDLFCEAYTPFVKILQSDPTRKSDGSLSPTTETRGLELSKEGLWSDGEKIGQLSMKMTIQNNIFIKQMKACTRTESGIIESTPLFRSYFANSSKEHKQQKSLKVQQTLTCIQNFNKEINQNSQLSFYNAQKLKTKMIDQFQKIKQFYQTDLQSSFYVPANQEEANKMMDEQSQHLSVVLRVMGYAEDDDTLTDVCWRIINDVMRRGEFELSNIGFSKADQVEMKKGLTSFYRKKIKVALQFQEIQYKLLLQSLRIGYIEGRDDPRQAVEMFRAYAYFRVPCYREIILRKVVRKEDSAIQWNTNIADEDIETMPEAQNILSTQLDWENNFYKPLEIESRSQALTKQMLENLEGSLWLEQISKRGSTFFYFLYFLISKLSQLGKRIKFIKWQYFPGYNKLVRAFLYEMKNIKIERYPPSMVQTSVYLLNNDKLLNILISMVFEKTNSNDPNGLMKGLDLISRYLNHFNKNKKLLPPSFNYVYFFKAIKIVLEGEFAFGVIKILSIIFMNYDNFNVEFRRNLSFYLLGRVFFRLFLNWSFTIRKAFYHVLILKIQRTSDVFDSESRKEFSNNHEIMNQITARYQESLKIVRNAYEVRKGDTSDKFRKNDQELYKKLKRKIAVKKKGNDKFVNNYYSETENQVYQQQKLPNPSSNYPKYQSKYSISELAKSTHPQRSQSVRLDHNILKLAMQNVKRNTLKQPSPIQEVPYMRTRSGTTYIEGNEEPPAQGQTRKLRERKRSIYGMDQFQMREMDGKEIQYLGVAIAEFDALDEAIRKYYRENNELPICELDVQVPIDEKQIKPLSADFEEWQASESSDDA